MNRLSYLSSSPRDEEIVVFDPPLQTKGLFIKRLIGSPGERLRIHAGSVYRKGVVLNEPDIAQKPAYEPEVKNYGVYVDGTPLDSQYANIPPRSRWQAPDCIPADCFFMLGDNRNDSEDSHIWGFAQDSGTFFTGPLAGREARAFQEAVEIISPRLERLR